MAEEEEKKEPRVYYCPKCNLKIENFVNEYLEHRLKCSNNDPKVIESLKQIGLIDKWPIE